MTPDIIGTIYQPTGKTLTDPEGFEYPEQEPIAGYHVNFTAEVLEFAEYRCYPATPRRVYAGHDPVCYSFPDKETFDDLYTSVFGSPELST